MKNKKLISMLLLPAALVACNDDDFTASYEQSAAKEVVEGLTLSVGLDAGAQTRGEYAGAKDGIFQNFYLEPAFKTDGTPGDNALDLSDNTTLKGDMIGLCLTSGSNAITNLPFYIAGYSSTKATTTGAKTSYFPFAAQDGTNKLYQLGLVSTEYQEVDSLYNGSYSNQAETYIKAAVKNAQSVNAGAPLAVNNMDVRKGLVRTNAGVMSGQYVAYYPYDETFTEPGGVPVKSLDAIRNVASLADDVPTAVSKCDFYDVLFACSKGKIDVTGDKKRADVNLTPVTGAIVFNIYNTNTTKDSPKIKLITVKATENAATTDFALEGTIALGESNTFTAKKTTEMIGASFTAATVAKNTAQANGKKVMLPCYTSIDKKVTVYVYTDDGKVAKYNKTKIPGNGKVVTYNIDLNEGVFEDAERFVYDPTSFKAEINTAGTLVLLADITSSDNISVPLTIKGNHKLTLSGTISSNLTCEEGTSLVLNGNILSAVVNAKGSLELKGSINAIGANAINAKDAEVATGAVIVLEQGTFTTLANKGDLRIGKSGTPTPGSVVNITTFDNEKTLKVTAGAELVVATWNNKAGSNASVAGTVTATTINNAAAVTGDSPLAAGKITFGSNAVVGEATVDNEGDIIWNSTNDFKLNVTNNGTLTLDATTKFTGAIENHGTVTVATGKTVEATAGTITNKASDINVKGSLILSAGKLIIEAGKLEAEGTVSGSNNVTVSEGAEFVKTVNTSNDFMSALGSAAIAKKYTGVRVATAIVTGEAISTTKKIYMDNDLTLFGLTASELNGGLAVTTTSALTANATISAVEIAAGATMTVDATSNLSVTGVVTNNGTFKIDTGGVVYCAGIAGTGTWTNYPIF